MILSFIAWVYIMNYLQKSFIFYKLWFLLEDGSRRQSVNSPLLGRIFKFHTTYLYKDAYLRVYYSEYTHYYKSAALLAFIFGIPIGLIFISNTKISVFFTQFFVICYISFSFQMYIRLGRSLYPSPALERSLKFTGLVRFDWIGDRINNFINGIKDDLALISLERFKTYNLQTNASLETEEDWERDFMLAVSEPRLNQKDFEKLTDSSSSSSMVRLPRSILYLKLKLRLGFRDRSSKISPLGLGVVLASGSTGAKEKFPQPRARAILTERFRRTYFQTVELLKAPTLERDKGESKGIAIALSPGSYIYHILNIDLIKIINQKAKNKSFAIEDFKFLKIFSKRTMAGNWWAYHWFQLYHGRLAVYLAILYSPIVTAIHYAPVNWAYFQEYNGSFGLATFYEIVRSLLGICEYLIILYNVYIYFPLEINHPLYYLQIIFPVYLYSCTFYKILPKIISKHGKELKNAFVTQGSDFRVYFKPFPLYFYNYRKIRIYHILGLNTKRMNLKTVDQKPLVVIGKLKLGQWLSSTFVKTTTSGSTDGHRSRVLLPMRVSIPPLRPAFGKDKLEFDGIVSPYTMPCQSIALTGWVRYLSRDVGRHRQPFIYQKGLYQQGLEWAFSEFYSVSITFMHFFIPIKISPVIYIIIGVSGVYTLKVLRKFWISYNNVWYTLLEPYAYANLLKPWNQLERWFMRLCGLSEEDIYLLQLR